MEQVPTEKLTVHEWDGVTSRFNLADGHPRQSLAMEQRQAMHGLEEMFVEAAKRNELEVKEEFEQAFYGLAGQPSVLRLDPLLSQYSGSAAIEIMANYLRMHKKTVTMMDPTFDSLADTLKRHNVPLTPMPVEELLNLSPSSPDVKTDCLYLVVPNNPTGHCPTREQFINIVEYCKKYNVMLMIDFCFRFYGDFWDYDQYQVMQDAGIEFITTEDTGKSFPAGDVKLGMVISSHAVYQDLKDISDDFLFSVAPFVFKLITRFIGAEHAELKRLHSQDLADANRDTLHKALEGSKLKVVNPQHKMGLDWLEIPEGWNAELLCNWLYEHEGPELLPGERFFWNDFEQGTRYLRIALLRDPAYFTAAVTSLRSLTDVYRPDGVVTPGWYKYTKTSSR